MIERSSDAQAESHESLQRAWSRNKLRVGDQIGGTDADLGQARHPNQYHPRVIFQHAFMNCGKIRSDREGIEGEHRVLSIAAATSSIIHNRQERMGNEHLQYIRNEGLVPFFQRSFDASENMTRFGKLQNQLMPIARYPIKNEGDSTWTVVGLDDFMTWFASKGTPRPIYKKSA